ncbi:MAG: hypothetical protein GY832_17110 [Chloroflexi bacterium]|nr:hypothetical protein [Chloroflexota bacterium]
MSDYATFIDLMPVWFFSAALLGAFLLVRLSIIKSWFILKPLPGLLSAQMIYAAFPLGVAFLILGLGGMFHDSIFYKVGLEVFFLLVFASFLFMIRPPRWVKPRWLRWLEYEYSYCLDILIKEARVMGRWNWGAQVSTRVGLEQWVESVVKRHRQEIDERWEIVREYRLVDQLTDAFMQGKPKIEDYVVPNVPEHRRAQEETRLEERATRLKEYGNSGYFRPTGDFPDLDQQLESGDTVIWQREKLARGVFWGTKATVVGSTSKRIKIELSESGKIVAKYVKPEKLILEQYVEKTK